MKDQQEQHASAEKFKPPIYLDYNGSTPVGPDAAAVMHECLRDSLLFAGNPSSSHWYGLQAKKKVEEARQQVASLLNCAPDEVIFTSGGTESDNLAIVGMYNAHRHRGNHIIASCIEHPAVSQVCDHLAATAGATLTYMGVDEQGIVDLQQLEAAITPSTILITVMHANNEVGSIQPIAAICDMARRHGGITVHTDASQSVGKIAVDVAALGCDLLTVAGHKLYAPKGIGALYIRRGTKLQKQLHGGDHEAHLRPGTENVMFAAALGAAANAARVHLNARMAHSRLMRDRLWDGFVRELHDNGLAMRRNADADRCLPNTLSISFAHVDAAALLSAVSATVAASAGAACHSHLTNVSGVLHAMKVPDHFARGTLRFSVGEFTTAAEIDTAVAAVSAAVKALAPRLDASLPNGGACEGGMRVALTELTGGQGCGCKIPAQLLERVLAHMPKCTDGAVLVGTDTSDDAAVYQLAPDLALIHTIDFFTPVCDEGYAFGQVAAANALSDVYAMGGTPTTALSVVAFPLARLPLSVLEEIMRGANDKVREAGIHILGGHSINDNEPKFGLAVTGVVHPDRVLRNSTAKQGDALVLTKPLGLGILATAAKRRVATAEQTSAAIAIMAALNNTAAKVMLSLPVLPSACTDVTGFGLLGHLVQMMRASDTSASIAFLSVPVIPAAAPLAALGCVPGAATANAQHVADAVLFDASVDPLARTILCDPQTSGGLLISIPRQYADELVERLHAAGVPAAACIGLVGPTTPHSPLVRVLNTRSHP